MRRPLSFNHNNTNNRFEARTFNLNGHNNNCNLCRCKTQKDDIKVKCVMSRTQNAFISWSFIIIFDVEFGVFLFFVIEALVPRKLCACLLLSFNET